MIRTMIIDDEPLARSGITARLAQHPDCEIVAECTSAENAAEQLPLLRPDLVFLDICMTGLTGIELLDSIPRDDVPAVVFLTAHDRYALDAFRHEALDYLLKPVDDERFNQALDRARRLFALRARAGNGPETQETSSDQDSRSEFLTRFTVTAHRRVQLVHTADIDWIEGLGDYAGLHVGEATHLIRKSLSFLEKSLDPALFLRIHRSAIVNSSRIERITRLDNQDSIVTLNFGQQIRASRTYYMALKKFL